MKVSLHTVLPSAIGAGLLTAFHKTDFTFDYLDLLSLHHIPDDEVGVDGPGQDELGIRGPADGHDSGGVAQEGMLSLQKQPSIEITSLDCFSPLKRSSLDLLCPPTFKPP